MHPARLKFKQNKRFATPPVDEFAPPVAHHVRSGVLPFVRQLLKERPNAILDLGPPTSHKCVFLSRAGTQVYWDNTRHSICQTFHGDGVEPNPSLSKDWSPPDIQTHIDLVLAWSYFDYLAVEDIKRLFDQLNRHFIVGSRFYFLIHHSKEVSGSAPVFELELDDALHYTTSPPYRSAPRHPPKMLEQLMTGFEIEKLYLMSNGAQEHLFRKSY